MRVKRNRTKRAYESMLRRCYKLSTSHKNYKHYMGIGVYVCKRWLKGYKYFLQDMGECPIDKSLDRKKDPKTGFPYLYYSKRTCQWANKFQQARNRKPFGKIKEKYIYLAPSNYKSKYMVTISIYRGDKKHIKSNDRKYIGVFKTLTEAIKARDNALEKYYGN